MCGVFHFLCTAPRFTRSGRESLVDQCQGKVDEAREEQRRLDQERDSLEEDKSELQEKLSKAEVRRGNGGDDYFRSHLN